MELLEDSKFRLKYKEDVLYIDPPYNQRQYGPNYHLYETFARYDNPPLRGKTGLRNWKDECYSKFCNKKNCLNFLKDIIKASTAKLIFISYNSDGLLTKDEIKEAFHVIEIHEQIQRRFKADISSQREYNNKVLFEYLFEIKKKFHGERE